MTRYEREHAFLSARIEELTALEHDLRFKPIALAPVKAKLEHYRAKLDALSLEHSDKEAAST